MRGPGNAEEEGGCSVKQGCQEVSLKSILPVHAAHPVPCAYILGVSFLSHVASQPNSSGPFLLDRLGRLV